MNELDLCFHVVETKRKIIMKLCCTELSIFGQLFAFIKSTVCGLADYHIVRRFILEKSLRMVS